MNISGRKTHNNIFKSLRIFLLCCVTFFSLFPFLWMIFSSLKLPEDLYKIPIIWLPKVINWRSYIEIIDLIPIFRFGLNTIIVAVSTALITSLISTMGGYALARFKFKGLIFLILALMISYMLPGVVLLIPFYFMLLKLGLNNSLLGLIIVYGVFTIPFGTLLMRNYIESAYPKELEESANIDGANPYQVFFRITIPLSAPGISAVALFAFIVSWNEFMYASILISEKNLRTIQTGLFFFFGRGDMPVKFNVALAAGTVIVIPVMIAAFYIQRYMVTGLTLGATKG